MRCQNDPFYNGIMGPDFAIGTGWYKVSCYLREYFISVLMALEFWFDESMEDSKTFGGED
jgi:hypothetical protein